MTAVTEAPGTGLGIDAENPWPGLSAFDESARGFFAGRDAESAELLRLVGQASLTVLFGKSGLGKTSLLQAGLFPLLREQNVLPVYLRLDVRDRTGPLIRQVAAALEVEIARQDVDAGALATSDGLWEGLHAQGKQWWSRRNQPLVPLLVFDQFEEIFTVGAEHPEGVDRLRLDLADLIENRIPGDLARRIEGGAATEHLDLRGQRYKVLLSFREDFLPEVEGWKADVPSLMRNRLRLLPMGAEQALQVVSGRTPSGPTHALVGDEAAREIVRFVAVAQVGDQAPGARRAEAAATPWEKLEIEPALLSLVCAGLNDTRRSRGQTTIDAALLKQSGAAIISGFYGRCVADVPAKTRRFIEDALITEGGFRNSYPLQDALEQGQLTPPLLRQLVDRRLLRIDHQLGTDRVELIHDRLTGVIREHRDKERDRLRARRQRRVWWAAGSVLVALCVVGLVLFGLWQNARRATVRAVLSQMEAEAGQLAMRSRTVLDGQASGAADAGLLLAAAAYRLRATNEAYASLQYGLAASPKGLARVIPLPELVAAISPDGRTVATRSDEGLRLWDVGSGRARSGPLPGLVEGDSVESLGFSVDGRLLAAGTHAGSLVVWDVATGRPHGARMSEKDNPATAVALSPDGKTLASGHRYGVVRLWDLASGRGHELSFTEHRFEIASLAFSPDGTLLASGNAYEARLWVVATGQPRGAPLKGDQGHDLVAFSPDGSTLASGDRDTVVLTSVATPDTPRVPRTLDTRFLSSLVFSHDGRWLATSEDDGVRIWDATTGQPRQGSLAGGEVTSLAFAADDKSLVSASADRALRVWDLVEPNDVVLQVGGLDVVRMALSPDGRTLATGTGDGSVRLWDAATGLPRAAARQGHAHLVTSLVFSPDGKLLASGAYDGSLRLWDTGSGDPRGVQLQGHKYPVTSLAFSPDNTMLASGDDAKLASGSVDTLRLWDVASGQPRGEPLKGHEGAVTALAFSPDGRTLASGSEDKTVRLWDATTGRPRGGPRAGHTDEITTVAFSPDGTLLVSGSADKTLCPWYVASEASELLRCSPLRGHGDGVTKVVFSPDGFLYASASADGTLRFWDALHARPRGGPLRASAAGVSSSVAFIDDRTLVSVDSRSNTLRRWDTPDVWIDRVCAKVARNLSPAEWNDFAPGIRYITQCPGLPVPSN